MAKLSTITNNILSESTIDETAVLTGNQTITLSGDVTGSGATAITAAVDKTAITGKTSVSAATGDLLLIADVSDSNNLKNVTVQSILNLAGTGTTGDMNASTAGGAGGTSIGTGETSVGTVSITPQNSSSKIQIIARANFVKDTGTTRRTVTVRVKRSTTQVGQDSVVYSQNISTSDFGPGVVSVIDTHGLSSAITYTLYALCDTASGATSGKWEILAVELIGPKGDAGTGLTDGDKGDVTISGSGSVFTIDSAAVTYAKFQNVAANSFLANVTGTAATVQEIATTRIPLFSSAITGSASASTFLRGDGSWNAVTKSDVGLGSVENTALSTWAGSANITTLGTIGTGTWNATTISVAKGGTGLTALGTANQLLRVNAGATALEYFTPSYLTANQSITFTASGDVSGSASGTTAISPSLTLATITQSTGASFVKITLDTKGRVTGNTAVAASDINAVFGSQTANFFYAAPNGTAGSPTFRAIVAGDIPTLNQNTTGSAGSVANSLIVKADSGTTEGTDLYTFNGSAAKTLNIVAGTNITITKASGQWTIASTGGGGGGITSLNSQTGATQTFSNDTNVTITSATNTHTLGWSGQLAISRGGTGASTASAAFDALNPMTTLGDIIYEGTGPSATRLAGNTSTTKQFLSQTGTGTVSAAPSWSTVSKSDVGLGSVENTALSTWAGSANITTLGTISTGTWSGSTIAVNKGGTGLTALGTANQLLRVNAGATALEYFTPSYLTANQTITLSGAVTGSGTTSISATLANSVVGVANLSATGTPSSSTYLRGDNTWASVSGVTDGDKGDITVSNSGATWTIDAGAVTYADIQNVAANTFLANATGTAATVQEIATSRIPLFASAITGTPSASTYLRGDGSWATVSGSGTVTSVAMTVPTGLTVTGSPITTSGTLALTLTSGYDFINNTTQTIAGAKTFSSAPTFSTMTAGSILFAGTSGVVSQSNANLFWDNSNSRLGIGTSSPVASIDTPGTIILSQKTAATSVTSYSSGILKFQGNSWSGSASMEDSWTVQQEVRSGNNQGGDLIFTPTTSATSSDPNRGVGFRSSYAKNINSVTTTSFYCSSNDPVSSALMVIFGLLPSSTASNRGALLTVVEQGIGARKLCLQTGGGNTIIGGTTDGGFKFDVNGTARVQGQLTVSTGGAAITGNSTVTGTLNVTDTFTLSDAKNIVVGSTTGTKIGSATTQKIGFWNAAPIVQPTTAVAAATVVANSGTAVNDASTFDGYTIAQVVKALRNTGLLA